MSHFRAAALLALVTMATSLAGAGSETHRVAVAAVERPMPAAEPALRSAAPQGQMAHALNASDLEPWLTGLLEYALKSGDIAGAEISIVKNGSLLFESGYGYADVARKIRMDPEAIMVRLGSTSKLFTWTAVMQLVEQGKIDLGRNVEDYLDFKVTPPGGKPITMQDLMNHRGGFEEGLKDIFALQPADLLTTEDFLKRNPARVLFPAGTVPAYSNYGAALAGYVVQRVSGEPYERYIEEHILTPLGMVHTTFEQPLPARYQDAMAQGYKAASEAPQPFELVATAPAGSGTTTAADMARFMLAHFSGGADDAPQVLRSETAELMHTPSEPSLPGFASMAHGFFHEVRNDRTLIGHGGDTVFFHTELDLLPQESVGIFYSFNSRGRDQAVYGLRKAILDQFIDRYFPEHDRRAEPPTLASAKSDAARISGRYETSRRIEHGFLSFFYLLQQSVISADPDGTLNVPRTLESGLAQFHEISPDVWREVGGTRQIALQMVDGISTLSDSEDPTSVLQRVPMRRSSALNIAILGLSMLILLSAVLLWPVLYQIRRHYRHMAENLPKVQRPRRVLRVTASFGLVWMLAWVMALMPVLNLQLDFYTGRHDWLIRLLQIGGLGVIVAAGAAFFSFVQLCRSNVSWASRIGNGAIAFAMMGLVWIGFAGGLMSLSLNY